MNKNNINISTIFGDNPITFTSAYKVIQQEGNLAYEYNPLRNYRLQTPKFEYNNEFLTLSELQEKYNITLYSDNQQVTDSDVQEVMYQNTPLQWKKEDANITNISQMPVFYGKGSIIDLDTEELQFDLNNPVNVLPQWSYDGSTNLIINDGKSSPRLINTRFSPIGRNRYQIVDRKGDNDTNLYDQGQQFNIDTSLYKNVSKIPQLKYYGTLYSGNLPIGNYHFYFKYMDADGNETDFITESGLVSVFIGTEPYNIQSGFREQNSYKGVQFILSNLDPAYQYLSVYYTRSTSDINENAQTTAYKINQKYVINTSSICSVKILGFEDVQQISIDEINLTYNLASSVQTQDQCQNMLFLGNITTPKIEYKELQDLSLRFRPTLTSTEYNVSSKVDASYLPQQDYDNSYYNSKFIYEKTGYWRNEIYRFGIVYILSDNSLSPVFNTRGMKLGISGSDYSEFDVYDNDGERQYIAYNEETFLVIKDNKENNPSWLENVKGVVYLDSQQSYDQHQIYGIKFELEDRENVYNLLSSMNIKGFFFVRQKRIPTTLCQAFIIGIDKESHTPVIPYGLEDGSQLYISESFLGQSGTDEERLLTHTYQNRQYNLKESDTKRAAICPEYDINSPYFNTIFNGDSFILKQDEIQSSSQDPLSRLYYEDRYYYIDQYSHSSSNVSEKSRIQAVEDNVKLVAIDDTFFSARAGEAEEAFRYEYIKYENKSTSATNLVRGSFGPYLGLEDGSLRNCIVDIMIPGYSEANMQEYFDIRYQDASAFYAISDRMSLDVLSQSNLDLTCYRGDCYICQFTHRVNRNFQDPSAPINDKIVDEQCWKDNYEVSDGVVNTDNFDKINLGDVNAVQLGQWVTFVVRSTSNLNIRALDDSIPDEQALVGHPREFYPHCPLSVSGVYKTPEALCFNKGFEKSLSERYNFLVPDVPYIKNNYSTRILYSDIYINDAFKNGFRVFQGSHYRDYPKTYGSITKLIEFRGNLICVFEHGVALIPVNERAVAGQGSGGNVFINTSNVLPENPIVISDKYGSQWRDSVIKTPRGIYGVDTISKRIWRTNGQEFEVISDFKIQEFVNNNISLTERETTPTIGIRNVKTHYNSFKEDVMFTFYDNLYGFQEKVWNVCYNEIQQKWITFYSWIPSFSENIYNQFFSFNRDTSKWIAKLGISTHGNSFSDGVTLSNPIIDGNSWSADLYLDNRVIPSGDGIIVEKEFELVRDNYQNYTKFKIQGSKLIFTGNYEDITSELYQRDEEGNILKDDRGRRLLLSEQKNPDKIVLLLNIRAKIKISYPSSYSSTAMSIGTGQENMSDIDSSYYESVVAVIPKYNMQFLTTDFWKHGQGGIIDIADKIYPTYWYGKQHPFEFEFIVSDNPQCHKIFDNLQIISNNAEPESFHYEIVGDSYDFAQDKKNMYIRQEATKELYQYNGCDITYDSDYNQLESIHRPLVTSEGNMIDNLYDRSTIMPLYYSRQDTINEVEDSYHLKDNVQTKDYSALSGGEIVKYENLDEYRICNHAKAVDMNDYGRLRSNMQYNEDQWLVQINPINVVYKNEQNWGLSSNDIFGRNNLSDGKIPIELGQSPIPDQVLSKGDLTYNPSDPALNDIPENSMDRSIVQWNWQESQMREVKPKDKWIKIRIRYSGKKLAVITAIKTLYSISYS